MNEFLYKKIKQHWRYLHPLAKFLVLLDYKGEKLINHFLKSAHFIVKHNI